MTAIAGREGKVRAARLWNFFMPKGHRGADPSNVEYAPVCEAMGRFARPVEMCPAVGFLASDEASCVTGVVLPVDGGISI